MLSDSSDGIMWTNNNILSWQVVESTLMKAVPSSKHNESGSSWPPGLLQRAGE